MTDTIRWGVISTANIGKKRVIPAIQQSNNGIVAAISSRSLEKAQAAADELEIARAYGSYDELINDPEIDAIYNPLPNSEHAAWSIACAEAGKPTLCEKPLASDAHEAQSIVDAFASRDILFAEAFMYRFHPQSQRVKALLQEGAVGAVQLIKASFTFKVRDEDNVRLNKSLAGGALMDVGCYCVNAMRFLLDEEPDGAQAFAQVGPHSQVDESLVGLLRFPSGVMGHFDCGLRSFGSHTYEIRGDEGRIVAPTAFVPDPLKPTIIQHWRGDDYNEIEIPPVNQYRIMVEDFADALIHSRAPKFAPQDAVSNMAALDRLYETI